MQFALAERIAHLNILADAVSATPRTRNAICAITLGLEDLLRTRQVLSPLTIAAAP